MSKRPDTTETKEVSATEAEAPATPEVAEISEHGYHDSIIRKLGIVGWQDVEDMILAALLTGDSIMLYGPKGEAKTEVAKRLAMALNVDFREVDASKANFEDLGGFPNVVGQSQDPSAPAFIQTPLNIWGVPFVFIDEFARATPHIQNKLMEVIRSRRLMGHPTGTKWVFSAMNPLDDEYVGNNPVDIAAASRFSWVILSPISADMSIDDIRTVAQTRSFDDASALKHWTGTDSMTHKHLPETFEEGRADLYRLMQQAAKLYDGLSFVTREAVPHYTAEVVKLLKANEGYDVDGRRTSTLNRAILSMYCIKLARAGNIDETAALGILEESAFIALNNALATVDLITGNDEEKILSPTKLSRVHDSSKTTLATGEAAVTYQLLTTDDPVEAIKLIINNDADQMTVLSTVSKLLKSYPVLSTILASMPSCAGIPGVARGSVVKTAAIIHNVGHRLLQHPNHAIHPFIGFGDCGMSMHRGAYEALQNVLMSVDVNDPVSMISMKAAFMAALETTSRTLSVSKDANTKLWNEAANAAGMTTKTVDYTYPNWHNIHLRESLDHLKDADEYDSWTYMFSSQDMCLPSSNNGGGTRVALVNCKVRNRHSKFETKALPISMSIMFECAPGDSIDALGEYKESTGIGYRFITDQMEPQASTIKMLDGVAIPGVVDGEFIIKQLEEDGVLTIEDDSQVSNTLLFLANATHSLYTKYMQVMESSATAAMEYLNGK
jgi:hypothetical protein